MKALIHPTYFPSVAHFVTMAQHEVIFEIADNYQKQTYRNRMYIYGANGKLLLNVPIKHTKGDGHQKYMEVRIENDFPWQKQHWKSIETAYRTSPFFEFYEDDLRPLFEEKQEWLMDLNFKTIAVISELLQLDIDSERTMAYRKMYPEDIVDHRTLVNAKHSPIKPFGPYTQVFGNKFGYLDDLSILDLLCNEGTNALSYLQAQSIHKL